MIISYDALVDTLSACNGNLEILNEIMSAGDEVLNSDTVSMPTVDNKTTGDKTVENNNHDEEEIE